MIDLALLREEPETVRRSQAARGNDQSTVDVALEADRSRRAALSAFEELRAEQNAFGKKVAQAKGDEKIGVEIVARALQTYLRDHGLLNVPHQAEQHFLVSDFTESFESSARMFFHESVKLEKHSLWN